MEKKDNPYISPKFSSTFAFQEGRLYLTSDAKSLVHLFFFVCGKIIVLPVRVLTEYASKDESIIKMNLCE